MTDQQSKIENQKSAIGYIVGGGLERILPRPADRPLPGSPGRRLRRHPQRRLAVLRPGHRPAARRHRPALRRRAERDAPAARPGAGPARPDPLHQPGDPASPDARARARTRFARSTRPGRRNTPTSRRARCRSRPCRRTTPRSAWPPAATSPRSSATRTRRAISSSATPASRATPSASTWTSSSSAPPGVFGATGTGKSFLTRIVLAGLMHHNKASVLVFDMHNEYGYDDTASDTGLRVTGLKTKFASRVRVVGLGAGTTIRGRTPGFQPGDRHERHHPGRYRTADA